MGSSTKGTVVNEDSADNRTPLTGGDRIARLNSRVPELDGVRGAAILLVLIWHYFVIDAKVPAQLKYPLAILQFTWSGVDLFFVLSGFLIAGILLDAKNSKNYYSTFYARRTFRIFPLYYTWMVVLLACYFLNGRRAPGTVTDFPLWTYPLFLQNLAMSHTQTFGPFMMQPTWSLAVEEQFYLMLPSFIRFLRVRSVLILSIACIVGSPAVRLAFWLSGNRYFGPYMLLPCRADALGFGLLIAVCCRNQDIWVMLVSHTRLMRVALVALGAAVIALAIHPVGVNIFGLSIIDAFYACLLTILIVKASPAAAGLFRNAALRRLGTYSFAIYLWHEGISELVSSLFPHWSRYAAALVSTALVLGCAAVSSKYFEQPLLRIGHRKFRYSLD